MTSEYVFRPARPADSDAIGRLWERMSSQHRAYDGEVWSWSDDASARWTQDLTESIGEPDSVIWVAEYLDGPIFAFIRGCVRENPEVFSVRRSGEIWDMFVEESQRKRGVGTELMEAAVGDMKRRGAQNVKLHVAILNEPARRFYEKLGFEAVMVRMFKRL